MGDNASVACPSCPKLTPQSNLMTQEAQCSSSRRPFKRQKTDVSITEMESTFADGIILARVHDHNVSIEAKEDQDEDTKRAIAPSLANTSDTIVSHVETPITATDWRTAYGGWVWARHPGHARRHVNDDDYRNAESVVLKAYQRGEKCKDVQSGALGSQQLFEVCKQALDMFPGASTSGKWLLRVTAQDIDELWPMIQDGVLTGRLGPTAKTGPIQEGLYLICVYTKDFRDKDDVQSVYRNLCFILRVYYALHGDLDSRKERTHYYKADIVTTTFSNFYFTSSIDNGTFYRGISATGEVTQPLHFASNNCNGAKVHVKVSV